MHQIYSAARASRPPRSTGPSRAVLYVILHFCLSRYVAFVNQLVVVSSCLTCFHARLSPHGYATDRAFACRLPWGRRTIFPALAANIPRGSDSRSSRGDIIKHPRVDLRLSDQGYSQVKSRFRISGRQRTNAHKYAILNRAGNSFAHNIEPADAAASFVVPRQSLSLPAASGTIQPSSCGLQTTEPSLCNDDQPGRGQQVKGSTVSGGRRR